MRKIILCIAMLIIGCARGGAQSTPDDVYLEQENTRIDNANATEGLIATFIANNLNSYSLTQSKLNQVTTVTVEGVTQTLSGQQLQDAINEAKRIELRKLYFQQNPSVLNYYVANTISKNVSSCINSNFVNGTGGFSFASSGNEWNQYNNFPIVPTTPSTDGIISLVSNIADLNTVTSQFPNGLRMVCPTPTPLSGAQAIRLNNDDGNLDTSILRRRLIVTSPTISFNFALVLQNGHQDIPTEPDNHLSQPYFQYRLVDNSLQPTDPNYVLVDNHIVCDILDSRFHQGNLVNGISSDCRVLFTDWSCQVINTSQYQNKDVTLEILVSDCGQGGHFGYAYLDNFCNMNACTNSSFGDVNLNQTNISCPSFPLNITGNVSIPSGSTLSSLSLEVLNSGGTVVTTLTNYTILGNNFTFQLNQNNFGINLTGGYRFRTKALFTTISGGISNTVTASLNSNFDVTFDNCCPDYLQITTNVSGSTTDQEQAHISITATNLIDATATGVYHAGKAVFLNPGFTAKPNSLFRAYIEDCSSSQNKSLGNSQGQDNAKKNEKIELEKVITTDIVQISPNPASTVLNIDTKGSKIVSWQLVNQMGGIVMSGKTTEINVQNLVRGYYILNIILENNKIVSKKVILN